MRLPGFINGGSFSNLLDEASIEKIAISAWTKFWNKFLIFGNISAGIIGIYMSARIIKLIHFCTDVHLHTMHGWSMYLLGIVWDSSLNFYYTWGVGHPNKRTLLLRRRDGI